MQDTSNRLLKWLGSQNVLNGFLVSKPENVRWLSGFQGSFGLFLQQNNGVKYLISDSRYEGTAKILCEKQGIKWILLDRDFKKNFGKTIDGTFALEDTVTFAMQKRLKNWFPNLTFVTQSSIIEDLRREKTEEEIACVRKAQHHIDTIFIPFLKKNLKTGITERALAFALEFSIRDQGRYELSFDPIVAFGEHSAIPHHAPSEWKLRRGDNILIDCGAKYQGYCSDMTRNVTFGKPSPEFQNKYNFLLDVQEQTLLKYKDGAKASEIEKFCKKNLREESVFFTHSLGHGVGLEVHEDPKVNENSSKILQKNDIVTCEPGLYYSGEFGIRIEDLVLITSSGPEILSNTTKGLLSFD